jgi:UV DNA damage repair endonuclease
VVAILVGGLKCWTQFWKGTTKGAFQQSLVEIGSVVSEEKIFLKFHPPFFLIEISSNGQNCSILSQKVPKFELYKHNDELFNIYYGIFL